MLDYDDLDPDYTTLFRTKFMNKLDQIKSLTGSKVVDVIAHSYGGLIARYYVQSPEYRGDIRNLIMIGTPNHGCAPLLRLKTSILLLYHASRHLLPPTDNSGRLDDLPPFTGEVEYVALRAPAYRDSYAEFVLTGRLLWVPTPSSPKPREFEEWLKATSPDQFALTLGKREPPRGAPEPAPDGGYDCSPPPGNELCTSYYEYVASLAGRNQFISERARQKVLNEMLNQTLTSSSLKEAALKAGKALLIYFAGRLIEPAKATLEAKALEIGLSKAGVCPNGATFNRLLQEEMQLPGSGIPVGVNYFLNAWNDADRHSREKTTSWPRYITIAGQSPSPWKFLGLDGANDVVVSVESALLEPALDDHIYVVSNGISSSHLMLQNSERVVRLVTQLLPEPFQAQQAHTPSFRQGVWKRWSWSQQRQVSLSNYQPAYVQLNLENLDSDVSLEFNLDCGHSVGVWAYARRPQSDWEPLNVVAHGNGYRCTLPGSRYEKLVIGLRLRSPLDSEVRKPCRYELKLQAVTGEENGEESGEENAGEENATDRGTGKSTSQANTMQNSGQAGPTRPPRISAIYKSKQTTTLREHFSFHHKWVWDFGDGSPQVEVQGEQHLKDTKAHRFPGPGNYLVTASSLDSEGKVLKQQQWQVEIGPQDELELEFRVQAFDPPDISVRLIGPEAWVTGRPATFTVDVDCSTPEGASAQVVSVDPGRQFEVQWERPGTFQVKAAVVVRTTYQEGENKVSVVQTKVVTKQVKVATLAISQ